MAIAFGASLGTNTGGGVAAATITVTTTGAVPAGGRVVVSAGQFGTVAVTGVSDNSGLGLSWQQDAAGSTTQNVRGPTYSADCPSGLPSGTVITFTWSASASARTISAFYITGAKTGAAGYLTGTPAETHAFGGTTWTTASISPVGNALVVAVNLLDGVAATNTGTVTSPGVEIADFGDATSTEGQLTGYKIVTGGATTVAGTYTAAPGEQSLIVLAYAEAAGGATGGSPLIGFNPIPFMTGR